MSTSQSKSATTASTTKVPSKASSTSDPKLSPLDETNVCNFLSRVQALQRLCSDGDDRYPCGLLFVPGPDGRYNKGSVNLLKYLFHGATGKFLLDGTIEEDFDDLEESILIIQQSSVSIFWNGPAKKLIGPLLRKVPYLIEYSPTAEEEDDVDKFQMRKCIDFKRMILEAIPEGRGIGVPIPLGYEELNEIEGWPILQAFAMDSVFCPTGFFTARYVVADITEYMDVMFRAVDGFTVETIVSVLKKSIVPHMDQFIDMLDTVTADQRSRLTCDEVIGPLEMLFDFGELECAFPCDPTKKPLLLFGSDTAKIGEISASGMDSTKVIGDSLHVVVEACEPSSGVRWCRSYFLHYGKVVPFLPTHLVEQYDDADTSNDAVNSSPSASSMFQSIDSDAASCIQRLQTMYHTLVVSLKAVVMYAFANNVDVLEAGTFIQKNMNDLLNSGSTSSDAIFSSPFFSDISSSISPLKTGEWLQLHMDCMNALGEVIGIEDVDDMGGSCLMYIRASIHGINMPYKKVGSVAVGDTFLFSVNSGRLLSNASTLLVGKTAAATSSGGAGKSEKSNIFSFSLHPFVGDCFCITHVLPYFRVFYGSGPEETSAQRLLSFSRNPHILSSLGLGKMIETLSIGTLSVPVLTDNKALPYFLSSDIRVFSEGFIIEKLDVASLPILISTNIHIAEMWIVEASEALAQALDYAPSRDKFESLPDFYSPNGNLMIFRMRNFENGGDGRLDDDTAQFDEQDRSIRRALQSNPVANALAYQDNCEFIAFFVPTGLGSRSAQILSQCTSMWRSVLQAIGVPIHRGSDSKLPQSILISYLALLDNWSYNTNEAYNNTVLDERSPLTHESFVSILAACGSSSTFDSLPLRVPALGFLPLKCVHAYSEFIRMRPASSLSSSSHLSDLAVGGGGGSRAVGAAEKGSLVVISGLSGSGAIGVGLQVYTRLKSRSSLRSSDVLYHYLDISLYSALDPRSEKSDIFEYVKTTLSNADVIRSERTAKGSGQSRRRRIHVVVIIQSPAIHVPQSSLFNSISQMLNASVGPTITVMSPKCFSVIKPSITLLSEAGGETESGKFGDEVWRASHAELCQASLASMIVFIDDNQGKSSDTWKTWMANNNPSVSIVRLSPSMLRLEEDFFDELVEGLGTQAKKQESMTSTAFIRIARGVIDDSCSEPEESLNFRRSSFNLQSSLMSRDAIRHVCVRPSTTKNFWEIANLVRSLLFIFPSADVNSSNFQNTWSVPVLQENKSWWHRCIELARIKALTNMRLAKGKEMYDAWSSSFLSEQAKSLQELRGKMYSVHGYCRITKGEIAKSGPSSKDASSLTSSKASSSSIWLHVEANVGNIIIKVIDSAANDVLPLDIIGSDILLATGTLGKDEVFLLDNIFSACEQANLSAVSLISSSDVSRTLKLKIQDEAKHIPLVKSWYDGNSYVDVHGTRNDFRSDIDVLVQNYVDAKNESLVAYNDIILECADYI